MDNSINTMLPNCSFYNNRGYADLTESEKQKIDFISECMFSSNERINNASYNIMMLLIELKNEPNKYEPEDLQDKKDEIYKGLTLKECEIVDSFILAFLDSTSAQKEEKGQQRQLKRKE